MGPDAEEILELMQKQDDMVEVLQVEMDVCKTELRTLAEYCRQKEEELEKAQIRESATMEELERLKTENLKLGTASTSNERERESTENKRTAAAENLDSVVEMSLRIKELEFELEREKMNGNSKKVEFEMKKTNFEQKINELETELQQRKISESQNLAKIESLGKMAAEWKTKYEVTSTRKAEELMKLESQLEVSVYREAQVEEHIRQLLEELTTIRQEKVVSNSRVSALIEETATLRAKNLRLSKASTSHPDPDKKEMQKLLNDQSHLIAALREETKLLARKLEHDSREFRQSIKSLKQEKRDLEGRMDNLLRI